MVMERLMKKANKRLNEWSHQLNPEVCQDIFLLRENEMKGHLIKIMKKRSKLGKRKNSFCNRNCAVIFL